MVRAIKILILTLVFAGLLYAPVDDVKNEGAKVTPIQKRNGDKDGRDWLEASRGWIESGANFYPYSTGLNVGIGTTAPLYKLDVDGTGRFTGTLRIGAYILPNTDGPANYVLKTDGSGNVSWAEDGLNGPHDHMGETWTATSGTYGLRKKIDVNSTSTVYCTVDSVINAGTGSAYGGRFYTGGTGTGYRYGVYGIATAPSGSSADAFGSYGYSDHSGTGFAFGGYFYAAGIGTGYKYGVYGIATAPSGSSNWAYGSYGYSDHSGTGPAVGGLFSGAGTGTGYKYGVYGIATAPSGSSNPAYGSYGYSDHSGTGSAIGGRFYAAGSGTGTKYGVYAYTSGSGTRYAGYFAGDVNVTGTLSKGGGSFLIDHPLDPANKTLRHNFVESPENLCLYRGKVRLDANGSAVVKMPDYFVALTKENEATVNLTSVGRPFQVGYEWKSGYSSFIIYGEPDREVSYLVLADRDDPVMRKLYKPVEEDKGPGKICERGELLYPAAYGYPETMGRDYKLQHEAPKHEIEKPAIPEQK